MCFLHKVHNAVNANQKEKYEADLKKEIKKLQVTLSTYPFLFLLNKIHLLQDYI